MDIVIAILAKDKALELPFYLKCIYNQTYNKKNIHLYIRTNDNTDNTRELLVEFIDKYGHEYSSVYMDDTSVSESLKQYKQHEWNNERFTILGKIRQESVNYAKALRSHYFVADCDNFIVPSTLERLYSNKHLGVVSPMLKMYPEKNPYTDSPYNNGFYSNFHYEVDDNGYYKTHPYYYTIVDDSLKGIIRVECVHCSYFIPYQHLSKVCYDDSSGKYEYVIFSDSMRNNDIHQYIDNSISYGFLTLADTKEHFELEYNYWIQHITFDKEE
jgi:hypothetical protein